MSAIAGDLPHYEEALRALYRREGKTFGLQIKEWPADLKAHLQKMTKQIFETD